MLFEIDIIFEFQDIIEQYSKSDLLSTLENYSEHLNNEVKTNLNKNGTEKKSLRKKLEEAGGYLKIVKNPPVDFFDIPAWIAYNESILLGTSISCSKVDGCDISNANATCKEFIDGRNDFMMFAVELERVKVITVKKSGKNMAFLTIKDNSCSVSDVCVFSDVYEDFKELLNEGNTVLIHGEKDKKKGSMIVKSVAQI
jgi:DNA polymerase III alpha subunit